ncbi:hypothetical protein PTSG_01438 [Salpingoeca rosetta]|uniref:Ras modification protein ERF4 n=1 Tax=Salpingoeca rosetta (strain ATCC 50818 / BSB-021) TaxID=946362 RepID=F2U0C4_SALR5|nr:uncharacterized protein PTSG_01438 [Salpingoeca rosetta]EGD80852.1 hypothetical protein PTSG_01438 [Salpingoeca rosetta]|eukprot:XP_004997413.1 hypothetical protein PTSG_01438 [Salpingoeca rosetta]
MATQTSSGGGDGSGAQQPSPPAPSAIFIQRDFSKGTTPRFATTLPQQLASKISAEQFAHAITQINDVFEEAEAPSLSLYMTNVLSCLTGHLLQFCVENPYEKRFREVSALTEQLNQQVFGPKGLRMVDPLRRGLRAIEIQVLNVAV